MGRTRVLQPRAVFLLGVNEGVFPAPVGEGGLFTDSERLELEQVELSLTRAAADRLCDERFLAYTAATAASERLTLSYPASDWRGGAMAPSELIRQIRLIFPDLPLQTAAAAGDERLVQTTGSAFRALCAGYAKKTALAAALLRLLREDPAYAVRLDRLPAASERPQYHLDTQGPVLYPRQMWLSPTRIQQYHQCKFAYFCRYGLKVYPRTRAELTARGTGSLVHFVLEHIVDEYPDKAFCDLSDDALTQAVGELVSRYAREHLSALDDARSAFMLERIRKMCMILVRRLAEEFRQSRFTPVATELEIGKDIPSVLLETPGGAKVRVTGTVDRVDRMVAEDGTVFLRVVDYKTGTRNFRLQDVREGVNLQMLLYLFTLCKNGSGLLANAYPAGVLYMPAQAAVQNFDAKTLKMSGLLLDDDEVIAGMEKDCAGVFIPAKALAKGGYDKRSSSLASLEQLGHLSMLIDDKVRAMADELLNGENGADPLRDGDRLACDYCDYRAVCLTQQRR